MECEDEHDEHNAKTNMARMLGENLFARCVACGTLADGTAVAAASTGSEIILWDSKSGKRVGICRGDTTPVL